MESYLDFIGLPVAAGGFGEDLIGKGLRRLFLEEVPSEPGAAICRPVGELEICAACC